MAKTDDAKTTEPVEQDPRDTLASKTGGKDQTPRVVSGDRDSAPARAAKQANDEAEAKEAAPRSREDLPTNDEPPITMTAGAEELHDQAVQVPPTAVAPPRVIQAPPPPDPVRAPLNRRLVTEADINSPGFKFLSSHAQDNAELLILRPGDRVVAAVEVIGMNNPDDRMVLMAGAVAPEGDIGYLPTNYIKDHQRQRIMHQDAERAAGNRQ